MVYRANTYTQTYTYTRLEAIEDQFDHFLNYGGIQASTIKTVREGVAEQQIYSVGLYALNSQQLRILEVCLTIDWNSYGRLVLQQPHISRGLSGWDGTQSPEVKVAGRRFNETAAKLKTCPQCWVAWVNPSYAAAKGFSGTVPPWAGPVEERSDFLYDLNEVSVYIRTSPGHS